MLTIFITIAPIFILIVGGNLLRRNGIPSTDFWNINDKLVYWVLFPALLFNKTSLVDLSSPQLGPYILAILGGFLVAAVFSLGAGKALGMSNPVITSVLQGGARHNTFIAIAVVERLYGNEGLTLALLASAALIPATNLVVVTSMSLMLHNKREGSIIGNLATDLIRNPLLLSVAAGLTFNAFNIGETAILHDVTNLLGQAALPIVLLCVGANLRITAMKTAALPFTVSAIAKFLIFPVSVAVILAHFNITGDTGIVWAVAMIYALVPTASAGYTLARQMGGDAPLMASIITVHTFLAMIFLPVIIALLIL
jgi:hypothetical protein